MRRQRGLASASPSLFASQGVIRFRSLQDTATSLQLASSALPAVLPRSFLTKRALGYVPAQVEKKWQHLWNDSQNKRDKKETAGLRKDSQKEKHYVLSMFPYPSGQLHMGHVRVYTISDCLARYERMKGKEVLHPMGWDAFGLPAENAAIERGIQPQVWTYDNIDTMRNQMLRLGLKFDWDKEVFTCNPNYYKWTQWLFLKLHKAGLAYQKEAFVNWDPIDQTVLANEQVDKEGKSWRSGAKVEQKMMKQWFFKLTHFAEDLVKDLDTLPKWPEKVRLMQEHWIGRSQGAYVDFGIDAKDQIGIDSLRVFTTRVDTLFGVTYVAIASEHPLVTKLLSSDCKVLPPNVKGRVEALVQELTNTKNRDRLDLSKSKKGLYLGVDVVHPLTKEKVPVYVADYVLMDYGTGAAMGVPAHDERDFDFAKHYDIPLKQVVRPCPSVVAKDDNPSGVQTAFCEDGLLINSGEFDNLTSAEARTKITDWVARHSAGGLQINYRVKDWLVSRQRYWGTPIPVVYCHGKEGQPGSGCGMVPVPEEQLPVVLPHDVHISARGGSPLAHHKPWLHTNCPRCGGAATRETDTMDTFVDSSWYFLRYPDANNEDKIFSKDKIDRWMPMDIYIGGIEHAILHLLYSRFITKFLHSEGYISCKEPFPQLLTQGLVTGKTYKNLETGEFIQPKYIEFSADGKPIDSRHKKEVAVVFEKMSKSKYNGTDPDLIVKQYGADTARLFVLFKAPPQLELQWDEAGVVGQNRWLNRLWTMMEGLLKLEKKARRAQESTEQQEEEDDEVSKDQNAEKEEMPNGDSDQQPQQPQQDMKKEMLRAIHDAIARVTQDLDGPAFTFNTAVAELMGLSNRIKPTQDINDERTKLNYLALRTLSLMLAPMAPHIAAEMFSQLLTCNNIIAQIEADPAINLPIGGVKLSDWIGDAAIADVLQQNWPKHDEEFRKKDEIVVAVQVGGRMRGTITVAAHLKGDVVALERLARESPVGHKFLQGKKVKKVVVPTKVHQPVVSFVLE